MKNTIILNEFISDKTYIGECQGIVTNTDTFDFSNYSFTDHWSNCTDELNKRFKRVLLIDVIRIKKEFRGMGYGKELIDIFINKSKELGSEAVILVADVLEPNVFDLVEWYEKRGFKLYKGRGQALPIMIKEF